MVASLVCVCVCVCVPMEVQQAGQTAKGQKIQYLLLTSLREVIALAISTGPRRCHELHTKQMWA
eukprot:574180-Amphidinium_carterae.2